MPYDQPTTWFSGRGQSKFSPVSRRLSLWDRGIADCLSPSGYSYYVSARRPNSVRLSPGVSQTPSSRYGSGRSLRLSRTGTPQSKMKAQSGLGPLLLDPTTLLGMAHAHPRFSSKRSGAPVDPSDVCATSGPRGSPILQSTQRWSACYTHSEPLSEGRHTRRGVPAPPKVSGRLTAVMMRAVTSSFPFPPMI